MAEAAISFAVETLGNLLIEKASFLIGVEGEVKWVQRELQRMQGFLKDASQKQANDESIRQRISEIRELAQDAEDVIETFVLEVENPRRGRGLLRRCACFPRHLDELNKLGNEIKSIKDRLEEIKISRQAYEIETTQGPFRRSYTAQRRRLSPRQRDKHLVGVDEDVKLLLQKAILEEREGLSVASIVGIGGMGKSTLARVLYNHAEVANWFDRRAWVVVSQQFNHMETIKELVLQLLEPKEDKVQVLELIEKSPAEHLNSIVYECLKGKRYLIVLDDVWRQEDWESLASAFPDEEDTTGRLLVTSRSQNVPRRARYAHEMKLLDRDKSWELLLKVAFNDNTNIDRHLHELEDIGGEILNKCNGLPLAIMVVGGLLLEQGQSRSGWEKVLQEMNSHFGRSGSSSIQAILELSYHDLPLHLKSCFLCLGFFKEDATIRADKLGHIWIAEGLIPHEQGGQRMEDIASDYLGELIDRNLVQVKDLSEIDDRVIKSCQIHDLLRDLSIRKANEEINFEILKGQGNSTALSLGHKPRHCAIYYGTESFNIFSTRSASKHLRSLFFYKGGGDDNGGRDPSYKWKNFRRLRVLNMEGLGLSKLPATIGELVGLRYLGLQGNRFAKLPSSIHRLKNLQVLDAEVFCTLRFNGTCKMINLRYLSARVYFMRPAEMDALKSIQTLQYVDVRKGMLRHLGRMISLRKLGITLDEAVDENELWTSLAMLENLARLVLRGVSCVPCLDGLVSLRHLTQLVVFGTLIELPCASNFPPNLFSLTLCCTYLEQDPMPILEKLPKLLYLGLSWHAYKGQEMVISHEGFPIVKVLRLDGLNALRNIKVEKGGMSELKQLEIGCCFELERLPEELKFMSNLQELKLRIHKKDASKFRDVNSDIFSNIPSVTVDLRDY